VEDRDRGAATALEMALEMAAEMAAETMALRTAPATRIA